MTITYREAKLSDQTTIADFQLAMALETEGFRLDESTCRKGVRAVFDNPALGKYFLAEKDGKTIASLLIINEWSDWRNGMVWWVHSVYVVPEARRQGAYSGLYRHIKSLVEGDESVRGLRLYVEKKNTNAQAVYEKLGMTNHHYELYEWMKTF